MELTPDRLHGVVDYATVAIFALAPALFNIEGPAAILCYALAGTHLLLSLISDMPLGLISIVSMPVHGAMEFLVGVALLSLPWFMPALFAGGELFFMLMGSLLLLVWVLSRNRGPTFVEGRRLDHSA